MMPNTIVRTMLVFSAGVLAVVIVFVSADTVNDGLNGFNRRFMQAPEITSVERFGTSDGYLAGTTTERVYVAFKAGFDSIGEYDVQKGMWFGHTIADVSNTYRTSVVQVDSPFFSVADRTSRKTFFGALSNMKLREGNGDTIAFASAISVGRNVWIMRVLNRSKAYVLAKRGPDKFETADVLERQGDGVFSCDGMLLYDSRSRLLVYVYYYRNGFVTLDTALRVVAREQTIDTVKHVKISATRMRSGRTLTLASPPYIVNTRAAIGAGLLFVQSNLVADNEDREQFFQNSTIDVYNVHTGRYLGSFRVPSYEGEKVSDIAVLSHKQFATIQGNSLIVYEIDLPNMTL